MSLYRLQRGKGHFTYKWSTGAVLPQPSEEEASEEGTYDHRVHHLRRHRSREEILI